MLSRQSLSFLQYSCLLTFSACNSSSDSSDSMASSTNYSLIVPDTTGQSIQFFDSSSEGNDFPNRVIYGDSTQLLEPRAVTYSTSNAELYVCDSGNQGVLVYTFDDIRLINDLSGSANILPRDIIGGANTQMNNPINCEVDNNELYVLDDNKILIFNLSELSRLGSLTPNNIFPARRILGGSIKTLSNAKDFVLVGNNVYVSNGDEIHVYPKSTDGTTEPSRVLTDTNDSNERSFNDIVSLATDGDTFLYVMNKNTLNAHHLSLYIYNDSAHTGDSTVDISVHVSYKSEIFQENPISFLLADTLKDFFILNKSTNPLNNSISKFSIYDSGEDSAPSLTPLQGSNLQLDSPNDIKIIETSIID